MLMLAASVEAQQVTNFLSSFKNKYPNESVKTIKHKHDGYMVVFMDSNKKSKAYFDSKAKWQKTETGLRWKEVPDSVKIGLNRSEYRGWAIQDSKRVETPNRIIYAIEVDNGNTLDRDHAISFSKNCYVDFTPSGKLIREEILQ